MSSDTFNLVPGSIRDAVNNYTLAVDAQGAIKTVSVGPSGTSLGPFQPLASSGQNLSVTTSSDVLTLAAWSTSYPQLRLCNYGTSTLFYNVAATATVAAGAALTPGAIEVITLGSGDTKIAAITSSGTASLNIVRGAGQ